MASLPRQKSSICSINYPEVREILFGVLLAITICQMFSFTAIIQLDVDGFFLYCLTRCIYKFLFQPAVRMTCGFYVLFYFMCLIPSQFYDKLYYISFTVTFKLEIMIFVCVAQYLLLPLKRHISCDIEHIQCQQPSTEGAVLFRGCCLCHFISQYHGSHPIKNDIISLCFQFESPK